MIGKVFLYEKLTISYDGPYDMVNIINESVDEVPGITPWNWTLAREKL